MMKKSISCLLLLSIMLSFCGCSLGSRETQVVPAAPSSASAAAGVPISTPIPASVTAEAVKTGVFDAVNAYEPGTAGSSLKCAVAAKKVLQFAGDNHLEQQQEIQPAVSAAWGMLTQQEKAKFAERWPSVSFQADDCFSPNTDLTGLFESAGIDKEMKALLADPELHSAWTALSGAVSVLPMPSGIPAVPEEEQKALLMAHYDEWAFHEPWESPWFYTFTDLDHNGRLEVAAACIQGTGFYTYANFFEVTADFAGIVPCTYEMEEGGSFPDVTDDSEPVPCYYDASTGRYYYIFTDYVRGGFAESYFGEVALCLHDGRIDLIPIASRYEYYKDAETESPEITYRDGEGNEISKEEYNSAIVNRFGTQPEQIRFTWTMVENPWPEGEPDSSWMDEPAEEVQNTVTSGPAVVITKNPTSESIAIGGKTWFIAHADNASAITWQFVSPDGTVYSFADALAVNPGLYLEALDGDTLAVSNVPLSFNGWGIQARFDGQGSYAVTTPAYLYVGDFISAYGSVIDKYRAAYTTGNSKNMQYLWDNGISEMTSYSTGVGYALKDLDKNGTPELIVAGIGTDDFSQNMVYDLYTLVNGVPVNLARSQARDRYYFRTDNTIFNRGSSGAGFSSASLYRLSGQTLTSLEGVMTYFPGNADDGYYQFAGEYGYEPKAGDVKITEAQFEAMISEYESKIYLPPLTKIA